MKLSCSEIKKKRVGVKLLIKKEVGFSLNTRQFVVKFGDCKMFEWSDSGLAQSG